MVGCIDELDSAGRVGFHQSDGHIVIVITAR